MIKQLWLNLPVKDIHISGAFYKALGFRANTQYQSDNSASFLVGQQPVVLMLFEEAAFRGFAGGGEVIDARTGAEILISIDAESKEEVDELTAKAVAAGGCSSHKPSDMKGWMYGSLFTDPDGHRWNVLYMDMTKMGG